jgi:NADH-quinone oxidoreductase subunit G
VAIVLSAQHSLEDNWALYTLARTYLGTNKFFVTGKPLGEGDDVLLSEDRNPNTAGILKLCEGTPPRGLGELLKSADEFDSVIALGGHVEVDPKELGQALKGKKVVVIASHEGPLTKLAKVALPACSWAEVDATFVNKKGRVQSSERALHPRGSAEPGWKLVGKLGRALGFATSFRKLSELRRAMTGGDPPSEGTRELPKGPEVTAS